MKKTKKLLPLLATGLLSFVAGVFALPSAKATAASTDSDFQCAYSAVAADKVTVEYGSSAVTKLTASQAQANGVPSGYTDNVLYVEGIDGSFNKGVYLDFSAQQVDVDDLVSLTFRVYIGSDTDTSDGYPEMRIQRPGESSDWVMRFDARSYANSWVNVTLDNQGGNFFNGHDFSHLANASGNLGAFELGLRANEDLPYYIDSITYQVKPTPDSEFACEYSAAAVDNATVMYGASAINRLTAAEAQAQNIPMGYNDDVLVVERIGTSTSKGILMDFSSLQIPAADVKSVSFRVYFVDEGIPDGYPSLRIRCAATSDWAMLFDGRTYTNRWITITLDNQGKNFYNSHSFANLANDSGYLGAFELGLRSEADVPFYVDSITCEVEEDFPCTYTPSTYYGTSALTLVNATQAAEALIPSGYKNDVLIVDHGSYTTGKGAVLDFSDKKIPISLLKSLSFKIYVTSDGTTDDTYPSIRIPFGSSWVMQHDNVTTDAWTTITLDNQGGNFYTGKSFADLANADGNLGTVELLCRANEHVFFFIDSVTYTLVDDMDMPQIIYDGEDTVYRTAGAVFILDVSATDATQGDLDVEYIWSDENAVNGDGTLNKGTYTLTLKATDYSKNSFTKQLTVIVGDPEFEPPVINVPYTELRATKGTIPMLTPTATDNSGWATVTTAWSSGALDSQGKLTAGTHTYTITATDPSQNTTVKTITVYVTDEENLSNVIDEQNPVSYTYYANGGTGSSSSDVVAGGDTITLSACMFSAPSSMAFKAWAIGSPSGTQMQPGDTITLTADTAIYAVWETTHAHDYNSAWKSNESGHWKECVCGEKEDYEAHFDKTTDSDHSCDTCGTPCTNHVFDANANGWYRTTTQHAPYCDCGLTGTLTQHYDDPNDKDHLCDTCSYSLGGCYDTDDHLCDECGTKLTDCEDDDNDHLCDLCGEKVSDCEDNLYPFHLCDKCNQKISDCKDEDNDHNCDICFNQITDCSDEDDHFCDICGEQITECEDGDNDHLCDICDERLSDCKDDEPTDHYCDICLGVYGECKDENNDHKCDLCDLPVSFCKDENNNHFCDICDRLSSTCGSTDGDHYCDVCDAWLPCSDRDDDHLCDICDDPLTQCEDVDNNHKCDLCGEKISNCKDEDVNGVCDICSATMDYCIDNDNDHLCDLCGEELSQCTDDDSDHNCDVCGEEVSQCADNNSDHDCDVCGEEVSQCVDNNHDHDCDVCGEEVSQCVDSNDDKNCDVCGAKIGGNETSGDTPPNDGAGDTPPTAGCKGGCNGSIGGTSALIALSATLFLCLKKRKEN